MLIKIKVKHKKQKPHLAGRKTVFAGIYPI